MKYDFDEPVRRRGTNCVKWDVCAEGVLPLWVADMDFRAAPAIVEALRRRAEEGVYGYALPPAAWHDSLAKWLAARHGWNILPEWAVDSTGVLPVLGAVLRACCEPGDKVVLQAPAYNGFFPVIASQGCEISWSPLRRVPARSGMKGDFTYEMDFEDLERKVADPRAKVFLISNPHNPAGRAWTAEELRKAGEICRRNGVLVASDEIHADLQMPGSKHVPFALAGDWKPGEFVTFWSATKAFNLAGLHAAVALCPDRDLRERVRAAQEVGGSGHLNAFGFVASATAWDCCADWLDELRAYLFGKGLQVRLRLAPLVERNIRLGSAVEGFGLGLIADGCIAQELFGNVDHRLVASQLLGATQDTQSCDGGVLARRSQRMHAVEALQRTFPVAFVIAYLRYAHGCLF